ncbi:MAG: DNA primase [Bacilli bacterium]|nr:DNA primase [Bacilli bacterium]MDD4808967.1 DNA primase [Bacilli bacterium]
MSMIEQEVINNIRNGVDIVDIISNYIPLIPRGKNYFGVCPFHDDKNPSMSVSKDKQIYTCFSCGATGNVFKFMMDYEHISFPESLKRCADIAGIPLNISINKESNYANKYSELYEIYDLGYKFYQNNINTINGKEAKDYLKSRQINDEMIKHFGIGLALDDCKILTNLLIKKKYDSKHLIQSGLVIKNEYGLSDIFKDRIMFPIEDINGRVVGFSGRIYRGDDMAKYINTKETDIFKKGELLYNFNRAKEECRLSGQVIVMEGQMDVIRAYSIGVKNVVATLGTAVTKQQALLIKKMAKEIIICFDGDIAGAKGTMACANELIDVGVIPKVIRLEDNLDPDDYIKKHGNKFLSKINNPMNVMDFKLSYLKHNIDLNDSEDMAKYVNTIIEELNKIDDEILREITIKKISEESKLDIEFLKSKLSPVPNDIVIPIKKEKISVKENKYQKAQKYLIFYMLRNKDVIKIYNKKITYMPTEKYRYLAYEIGLFYKENGYIDIADLISSLTDNEDLLKVIGELESLNLKDEYTLDEIDDYINTIKEFNINYQIKRLEEKMRKEDDALEKAKIADEIIKLKKGESND